MRLTSLLIEMQEGWASIGLYSLPTEDAPNPPHVVISVPCGTTGDAAAIRERALAAGIAALEEARAAIEEAR